MLTATDDKIFVFIAAYVAEHGWGPSYMEIRRAVKCSAGTAKRGIARLHQSKKILVIPNRARAITVLQQPVQPGKRVGHGLRLPRAGAPAIETVLKTYARHDAYLAKRNPHDDT